MAPREGSGAYHFDAFCLDPVRGALLGPDGAELRLRPKPFALLRHMLDNPGRLLGRDELMETLWPGVVVTDDSLTQCISDLRRAFGDRAAHVLRTLPKRGYMLVAELRRDEPSHIEVLPEARLDEVSIAPVLPDEARRWEPPLLVHRFTTPDGDQACSRLADALATDFVAAFVRLPGLRVMPASDAARTEGYRIQGEVRAAGDGFRITVRLEDAANGTALWTERLDQPRDAAYGLPEATLATLAAYLDRQVERHSLAVARKKPVSALTTRELCLVGRDHHERNTEADTLVAKEMFARAIAADPDYAPAYAWQAYTVHRAITHSWGSPGGQEARDEALRLARRAVQLQPDSPLCLSRLAFALVLHQRWEEALTAARSALTCETLALAATRNTCCEVLAAAGHAAESEEVARGTLVLNPFAPPTVHTLLGRALLLTGRPEEALVPLRLCASRLPDFAATYELLVVAGVETGRLEEARAARRELLRLRPDWEPRNHKGMWFFRRSEDLERFQAAHRQLDLYVASIDSGAGEPTPVPAVGEDRPCAAASLPSLPVRNVEVERQEALVVHPLQVAAGDAASMLAATMLGTELTAALVCYEDLRVLAMPEERMTHGFALMGDVHASNGNLFVRLRLEDLADGASVWSQRIEWPLEQQGDVPAASIATLAAAINLQVGRRSLRRARQKPVEQLTARELTLLGREVYNRSTPAETRASRDLFARASAVDPDYASARAWHVFAIARPIVQGWPDGKDREGLQEAVRLARLAAELEPDSPLSLAALSLCLALQEHWGEAVASARLALRTDRVADDAVRMTGGAVLAAAGFPEEAEVGLRQMIAWDPHCPPVVHAVLGRALLLRGQAEEALAELRLCAARLPDYELCLRTMVVAAMEAGQIDVAREALREVARLRPGWVNGTEPIFWFMRKPEDRNRHQKAFEMAVRLEATARAGGLLDACTSTS
ncbi:winged helix-turn-helix domain-containing protein [Roseomonas sp. SSH11]|uniref:Winged helix-turn-helix domain-containing protein n=1 Tax=Pararoseomonas baculiformis TaxID=2820812 RepID=A0ABS4AFN7_9PROT|nr:winged helix-turn-helix domain-containing protein [Pararoseomonas baculiformis]MBP0445816.1 winged helix-turn-helix domain-containing protein [Pararoseomonas baculiformis]